MWWNPNESGWGVVIAHQFSMMFAVWYTYDPAWKPIWYVASNCPVTGTSCQCDLYKVTGGTPLTALWNGSNKHVEKVGTSHSARAINA